MNILYKKEALKWSNLFFILPLIVALIYNLYWYAIVLFTVFIVSCVFHFSNEAKQFYYLDIIFSSLLMFSNFILLFMGHWKLPFSAAAIFFALFALFFYFRSSKNNYYLNHSLWHIFSSGVCLFSLVTFISVS